MFKKGLLAFTVFIFLGVFSLVLLSDQTPTIRKGSLLGSKTIEKKAQIYSQSEMGIHNVVVQGHPFERGQQYGYFTQKLIKKQEKQLMKKLNEIFPNKVIHYALSLFSMGWFFSVKDLIDKDWLEEMYGVSLYAPKERIYGAKAFARQITYHGIHEMGQMMVDSGVNLGGCTQLAIKKDDSWVIGRNFDFEAGSVFDEEKVMKWVFPKKGFPFVSVSFAGMVGVITGVNQYGVYIAINAAGTDSYTLRGKPSTFIALKALQYSKTAVEAANIIKDEPSLISNIYVIADTSDKIIVVEKSPEKSLLRVELHSTAITNHMLHKDWGSDKTNKERMREQTTVQRYERGLEIVKNAQDDPITQALLGLRDKTYKGHLVFGHPGAIDALIASHSTIYDNKNSLLFVSEGPSLAGAFHGFDLRKSFEQRKPIRIHSLPADVDLTKEGFKDIKHSLSMSARVIQSIRGKHCKDALETLRFIDKEPIFNHYLYATAVGDAWVCENNLQKAKKNWQRALELKPAYAREIKELEEKINENGSYDSFIDWLSHKSKTQ